MLERTGPPRLDAAHFDVMTGGDRALQREVAALFRARAGEWEAAFAPEAPGAGWRDAAHTLKGSARGIGLWPLATACEAAEAAAPGGGVAAALRYVRAALEEALEALDAHERALDSTGPSACVMRKRL